MDENTQDPKTEDPKGITTPGTNQTFTQAENDRLVGQAIVREREKFKDYDDNKQLLETLLGEKKAADLAGKTESERLSTINSDLTTELTNVKSELITFQKERVRNDVLNSGKYASLPRAYKNMVTLSDNQDEVQKSAESILEEYSKDTGKTLQSTFGIKPEVDTTVVTPKNGVADSPQALADSLRSKVAGILKNRG